MSTTDNINYFKELAIIAGGFVASGAVFYAAISTWSNFDSVCYLINKVSGAKDVPISDLRSLVSSESSESGSKSKEMFVMVRGITKLDTKKDSTCDTLVSQATRQDCVVLEQTWGSYPFGQRRTAVAGHPFILSGSGQEEHSNEVLVKLEGSVGEIPLEVVFDLYNKKIPNIFGTNRLPVCFTSRPEFLVQEKILPVGKEISVIGFCSLENGNLQIKACKELPFFLLDKTKDELVKWLTDGKILFYSGGLFLAVLSLAILVHYIGSALGEKMKHVLRMIPYANVQILSFITITGTAVVMLFVTKKTWVAIDGLTPAVKAISLPFWFAASAAMAYAAFRLGIR